MASISGPGSSYKPGHKIILRDKISASSKNKLKTYGYIAGKSIFELAKPNVRPDTIIKLMKHSQSILLKDAKGAIIKIEASFSAINNLFNHYSNSNKSNTNKLTEIKENISMWLFENPMITEDDILKKSEIKNNIALYDSKYFTSAQLQLKAFNKIPINARSSYHFERQENNYTKCIYKVARKLSKKSNDNWNPADVWMISKSISGKLQTTMDSIEKTKNLTVLNDFISSSMYNKDIIPISLKQVTSKASLNTIDPDKLLKSDPIYDLSFKSIAFSETFFNFIIQTKDTIDFGFRVGFKASATTMNVSIEGRYISKGYQAGAVDAKEFPRFIKSKFGYNVRSGANTVIDIKKALNELKKVNVLPNHITSYKKLEELLTNADNFTKQRFCNIVSYIFAFLNFNFNEVSKFGFYSSKKITKAASAYYIIS